MRAQPQAPEIGSRWRERDSRFVRFIGVVEVSPGFVTVRNGAASLTHVPGRKTKIRMDRFAKAFRPDEGGCRVSDDDPKPAPEDVAHLDQIIAAHAARFYPEGPKVPAPSPLARFDARVEEKLAPIREVAGWDSVLSEELLAGDGHFASMSFMYGEIRVSMADLSADASVFIPKSYRAAQESKIQPKLERLAADLDAALAKHRANRTPPAIGSIITLTTEVTDFDGETLPAGLGVVVQDEPDPETGAILVSGDGERSEVDAIVRPGEWMQRPEGRDVEESLSPEGKAMLARIRATEAEYAAQRVDELAVPEARAILAEIGLDLPSGADAEVDWIFEAEEDQELRRQDRSTRPVDAEAIEGARAEVLAGLKGAAVVRAPEPELPSALAVWDSRRIGGAILFALALGAMLLTWPARLRGQSLDIGEIEALRARMQESHASAYHRPRWATHACRSTRTEIFLSVCPRVVLNAKGCTVTAATCPDLYSGATVTTDTPAQSLQVDHLLSAKEAWGRRGWTDSEYRQFFNDADNLVITRARTNERKGDRGPDGWCPANAASRPMLAIRFRRIAARYSIPLTEREGAGLRAWDDGQCAAGAIVLGGAQ